MPFLYKQFQGYQRADNEIFFFLEELQLKSPERMIKFKNHNFQTYFLPITLQKRNIESPREGLCCYNIRLF